LLAACLYLITLLPKTFPHAASKKNKLWNSCGISCHCLHVVLWQWAALSSCPSLVRSHAQLRGPHQCAARMLATPQGPLCAGVVRWPLWEDPRTNPSTSQVRLSHL
jgi:hypothetical protein